MNESKGSLIVPIRRIRFAGVFPQFRVRAGAAKPPCGSPRLGGGESAFWNWILNESVQPDAQPRITREDIRNQWADAAAAWGKWEPYLASSNWPVSQRLMLSLQLRPGMRVLDVGCGIGDPSLRIAATVEPGGQVLGIDLAEEMVRIASARAAALDLANVEYRVVAVEELNEPAGSFDAIVSQFTIMLFVDMSAGLRKLHDLLRPGGRVAVSVWAPMSVNPMFAIPRAQLAAVRSLPTPPRDAPGPMRLSNPGELEEALTAAGFVDVEVADVRFYNFAKDPNEYFEMLCAIALMFRGAFDALEPDQRKQVRGGLLAELAKYDDFTGVRVPALARVGTATKSG